MEENLRSLEVERLDLVNLRLVDAHSDGAVPLEEQLSALEDIRQEGKLDLIGLSNVDQAKVQHALELVDVGEIQNRYSILDRQDEATVDFDWDREIAYVPFGPLGSAFRGDPARLAAAPAIARVADKHGATPTQIALAWLLARYDRMLLIPGTSSVAHLDENMAAVELKLDVAVSLGGVGSLAVGGWLMVERGAPTVRIAERSAVLFLYTSAINMITLILAGLGLFLGLPGPRSPLLSILPAAVGVLVLVLFLLLPRYVERIVRRVGPGRLQTFLTETAASVRDTSD